MTYLVSGVVTGVLLWFVAQGILAPFIGRPFMMESGAYTQSSFIGHVGMCVIVALVLRRNLGKENGVVHPANLRR